MPGSSVHGISQARILEWIALPPPGDHPDPGIKPSLLHWQADSLPLSHQGSLHTPLLDASMAFTLPRGGVTFWYIPSTREEAAWYFPSSSKLYGIKLLPSKKM